MGWSSLVRRAPAQAFVRPTFPPAQIDWARLVTLDFETYFDQDYTLKKLTTSEYIRDPRFKAQMVGIKVGGRKTRVVPPKHIAEALGEIDWTTHSVLCHHTQFDGFILQYRYGVIPKFYYDTLSMARGWLANDIGAGLDEVAQHFGRGAKHEGVLELTRGVLNWPPELYRRAAAYCANDVDMTLDIFKHDLLQHFPQSELDLIDATVQMFCCPVLRLDEDRARKAMDAEIAERERLLISVSPADVQLVDLPSAHRRELLAEKPEPTPRDIQIFAGKKLIGSNERFADLLRAEGIEPPTKISPAWMKKPPAERTPEGKYAYAFAQTDLEFKELLEHPDVRVRDLVETRLAVKSNINITRAGRLLASGIGGRPVPVYYKYAGAHTWRFSGGDKQNFQNFTRGGELRLSIEAPEGYVLVVADSGQIEARMNAWLWGQDDLLDAFRRGEDIYSLFATENIYGRTITKADKEERHVGKTSILGLGFQMGGPKFRATLARGVGGPAVFIDEALAYSIVNAYRRRFYKIRQGWEKCEQIIEDMAHGRTGSYMCISWEKETIWLPNGLRLKYPNLRKNEDDEWVYDRKGHPVKLYGGILCMAGDSEVLTDTGWKKLVTVTTTDQLWDGTQWVHHGGLVFNGRKKVIDFGGVFMTPDHEVLVNDEWYEAQATTHAAATSSCARHFGNAPGSTGRDHTSGQRRTQVSVEDSVRLWNHTDQNRLGFLERIYTLLRVRAGSTHGRSARQSWDDTTPRIRSLGKHARALLTSVTQSLQELWWSWNQGVQTLEYLRPLLAGHGSDVRDRTDAGTHQEQQRVQPQKLHVVDVHGASEQSAQQSPHTYAPWSDACTQSNAAEWSQTQHVVLPCEPRLARSEDVHADVYDLINAGPSQRFTTRGTDGAPFIVHNCENLVQALARIIVAADQLLKISARYPVVMTTHDEVVACVPKAQGPTAYRFMHQVMTTPPEWCHDIPLAAEGGFAPNYSK